MNIDLLESLPLAAIYVGGVVLILGSCEIGFQIGRRVQTHTAEEVPTSFGPMVGGLLAMLAFVLAMAFSMAASQHDLRRQNVLNEANAIGTAYLRADLLPPQYRTEVRDLLREYVDVRVGAANGGDVKAAIVRSVEIHQLLWAQVSAAALDAPSTNTALMVQATNAVIDIHEARVNTAIHTRIPDSMWLGLFAIAVLTMLTLGSQTGLAGKRALVAVVPLALAFAALIALVVDLDHPQRGMIKVSQQPMINLQNSMGDRPE